MGLTDRALGSPTHPLLGYLKHAKRNLIAWPQTPKASLGGVICYSGQRLCLHTQKSLYFNWNDKWITLMQFSPQKRYAPARASAPMQHLRTVTSHVVIFGGLVTGHSTCYFLMVSARREKSVCQTRKHNAAVCIFDVLWLPGLAAASAPSFCCFHVLVLWSYNTATSGT